MEPDGAETDMNERVADNKVQLGCGTLIVIAIIVMLFSGGNESRKVRDQLDELNRKIDRLEKKVDDLSQRLSRLP